MKRLHNACLTLANFLAVLVGRAPQEDILDVYLHVHFVKSPPLAETACDDVLAADARPLGTLPPGVAAALPPFHKPFDFVPNQSEELTCGVAAWRHGLPPGPTRRQQVCCGHRTALARARRNACRDDRGHLLPYRRGRLASARDRRRADSAGNNVLSRSQGPLAAADPIAAAAGLAPRCSGWRWPGNPGQGIWQAHPRYYAPLKSGGAALAEPSVDNAHDLASA